MLDPPFHNSTPNPGYIQGYVPGIRENGATIYSTRPDMGRNGPCLNWVKTSWPVAVFDMINPMNHGNTPEAIQIYKIEPYVLAGDVYSVAPHIGSGGWSWYTGSAGWMYRLIIESLLAIELDRAHDYVLTATPSRFVEWF